jgi:hypothetical protein
MSEKISFVYSFYHSLRQKIDDPLKEKNKDECLTNESFINFLNYPAITANNNKATMLVILIIGLTAGPAVSL